MEKSKRIALVAHDNRKKDLVEWVEFNYKTLLGHQLICTGTTGKLIEETILNKLEPKEEMMVPIIMLKSGPLGGDLQMGALIAEGNIDLLIFFWDPMQPQPHDVDVKALLRITVVYNIPTACNRSTADFMISSHLLKEKYEPNLVDYSVYISRQIP
ncbi:MAG: methylglyoxal synthase [Bacteroidales bacterium]|jgi:methylglyoxal synthase|nr:methylglyoxal synthase [Bacteroidales bacterium]